MKQAISKSLMAGLLISLGGTAYLACDNRYVGAALFAVGLMAICYLGYDLYTGKVCYSGRFGIGISMMGLAVILFAYDVLRKLPEWAILLLPLPIVVMFCVSILVIGIDNSNAPKSAVTLIVTLIGNLIAVAVCGLIVRWAMPELVTKCNALTDAKLAQPIWSVLVRAIGCGVLIYVAVEVWKRHQSMLGVLVAVPCFILCGFNHCIADAFYFAVADDVGAAGVLYIVTVIVGNSIGGLLHKIVKE